MPYKLGKTPATPEAVKFALTDYVDLTKLIQTPKVFGHQALIKSWGMLGNDQYGDCVWAGAAHETMLWNQEANHTVRFTKKSVLSDYTAVTGFKKTDPNTDQGTNVADAAAYRRKTGVLDAAGKRHKVAAYLRIKTGNLAELKVAAYLFGAVGIGIQVPASAQEQFAAGQPWDVVEGSPIDGGHYVPVVGFDGTDILVVTWGAVQRMTVDFFTTYCDEAYAYLSDEALTGGKSLEGFNAAQLQADLNALR